MGGGNPTLRDGLAIARSRVANRLTTSISGAACPAFHCATSMRAPYTESSATPARAALPFHSLPSVRIQSSLLSDGSGIHTVTA